MADQNRSEIIASNPIGKGLDAFRASFKALCEEKSIPCTSDSLSQLVQYDLQNLTLDLLLALQGLRASRFLPSRGRGAKLFGDLAVLNSLVSGDDFDFGRIRPLLDAVLSDKPDSAIWDKAYNAVTEPTPPPQTIASSLLQTPWMRNTSTFANSSEHRKYVDDILKEELGAIYVGLRGFDQAYFGAVAGLDTASEAFLKQCSEGPDPLLDDNGWVGWPKDANQDKVLTWFADFCERLSTFAEAYKPNAARQRRLLARPNEPIDGSVAIRKMDIGFVNALKVRKDKRCHWSHVLVPGELKSNALADKALEAWLDLGRYAREVFAAQSTRRFVLGFTLCGSRMRIWEFDRLGGIASGQFDIHTDGLQFVTAILGFLWMSEEQLGFDQTITTSGGQQYIDVDLDGQTKRLVMDRCMRRAPCIAGRATTCWKAHCEEDPQMPLVIKDSWQYPEREEEGELLREATERGVINVARYYHHETVQVGNLDDDIQRNVRKGLDVTTADNYRADRAGPARAAILRNASIASSREGRSASDKKRSSGQTGAALPPSKRSCSASPASLADSPLANRVHRRVILRDFGQPIYKASSRAALLRGIEGCITGHESLHKAGFLHRDISINNLLINEDKDNASWPAFLIDLDLAIKVDREGASGAKGKTGTRAFMAIGALLGEQHSFMHDLESFFWVLFWICIHYEAPCRGRIVPQFDRWNFEGTEVLATIKTGVIADEVDFLRIMEANFTSYFQPLAPWVNRLRRKVFPAGRWRKPEPGLYASMKEVLREAQTDPNVLADHPS